MPMVGQVQALSEGGYGFVVTKDNNRPAATFVFENEGDANAAQQKMQDILAKCQNVMGHAQCGVARFNPKSRQRHKRGK
jgi:hypothetical protein